MSLYDLLDKKKKARKSFENSEEYEFYIKYRELLTKLPRYAFLYNKEDDFDVMRANIVIYSILNNNYIEKEVDYLSKQFNINNKNGFNLFYNAFKEKISELPYYDEGKTRVYVPFFSLPLNIIYYKNPEKLLSYPYELLKNEYQESAIDCFDVYGAKLYDSYFTRLIKICSNGSEIAYFHYDTNTVYIVNSQGRLDNKIVLFDRYVKKIYDNHMIERLKNVLKFYFNNSRSEFIDALYHYQFISKKMYLILKKGDYLTNE